MCHCTVNSDGQGGQRGTGSQDSDQQALTRAQLCLDIASPVERSEEKGSPPEPLREHHDSLPRTYIPRNERAGAEKGKNSLIATEQLLCECSLSR